jgi:hypothetical protein
VTSDLSFEALALAPQCPRSEFQWMDFFYFLLAVLVVLFLMVSATVIRIRRREKSISLKNIVADLDEVRDDPNEPARWVP